MKTLTDALLEKGLVTEEQVKRAEKQKASLKYKYIDEQGKERLYKEDEKNAIINQTKATD